MKAAIETRVRTVTTEVEEEVIVLELTNFEARVLRDASYLVGGNPGGPRGVFNKLIAALEPLVVGPPLKDRFQSTIRVGSLWVEAGPGWPKEAGF